MTAGDVRARSARSAALTATIGYAGLAVAVTIAPAVARAADALGEDIRDIRGPKFILPAWVLPAALAGLAVLALAGYGLWRRWRRPKVSRPLTAAEIALRRLEDIRGLLRPDTARDFSVEVSDAVRRYIEARFAVTATHRTTEEFLRDLLDSSHATLTHHRALLAEFLAQCDLVKFADMSLTLPSMESLHTSARTFVLETAREAHDSLPAA